MDMNIRPMTPEERAFSYSQKEEVMQSSGCIGHLRGDMGSGGMEFFTTWDDHTEDLKTPEFKAEFDEVVNAFRFDDRFGGLLKDRSSLIAYCKSNPESSFEGNYTTEFGFRADTEAHSYMIRCNPNKGDYNFYIYAYDREMLDKALLPSQDLINVLVVEPGKEPYAKTISHDLESLQREVGGYIEVVYPFDDPVAVICDEEGKLKGSKLNRALTDNEGRIYDVLAGTFIMTGLGEEDLTSLSDELMQKYSDHFRDPEMFVFQNGKVSLIAMIKDADARKEENLTHMPPKTHGFER